jgi:hypothetical protein
VTVKGKKVPTEIYALLSMDLDRAGNSTPA